MTYQRIKIGNCVFNPNHIVYAHKEPTGEVAVNVFSDEDDGIDDLILQGEEARKFWQYWLHWEKTTLVEGCLVNLDHITFVRPAAEVEGRILVWLTLDRVSPFHIEGAEAQELWEAHTSRPSCLDLNDYEPPRSDTSK